MGAPAIPDPPLHFVDEAHVCTFVDGLPGDVRGEILTGKAGGSVDGIVFVEHGRICWAAVRGRARRLGDLLGGIAGLDGRAMASLYATCKARGTPLGEHLVGGGLVRPTDLRAALLQHTVECLSVLCAEATRASWVPRPRGGYNPRFTFTTSELLARTVGDRNEAVTAGARRELAASFAHGDWGVAYVSSCGGPLRPVALWGDGPEQATTLLEVGAWAGASLDVASRLQRGEALLLSRTEGAAFVAWTSGDVVFAGRTTAAGPARILNRRASQRTCGGLHDAGV